MIALTNFTFICMKTLESLKEVVIFAHNARAYDTIFVIQVLNNKSNFDPKVVIQGNKIDVHDIQIVSFHVSLNFMLMALCKIRAVFNFETKEKGYFPHFFNTFESSNYALSPFTLGNLRY